MTQQTVLPSDVLLVSFDLTHGLGNELCVVGKKDGDKGVITIVNAFEGRKAEDIFRLLTTVETEKRQESER